MCADTQSISQLPFIITLSGRNNLISLLTGLSYERLNWLHRASARTCVLTAWAHLGAMLGVGFAPSRTSTTGGLALAALSLLFLSSFGLFRRLAYEGFIALHILLGIVLLAALCVHRPMYRAWAWGGFVIWGFDRIVSLGKMGWASRAGKTGKTGKTGAVVEVLGADVVKVTVTTGMKWTPGQHMFLTMPSIALQQHPFTMASLASAASNASDASPASPASDASAASDTNAAREGGQAVFFIRAHKGFTRHLLSHPGPHRCLVDGPYGIPPALTHYASVTLLAGGTGISFCLALLLGLVRDARRSDSAVGLVHLVWNTRDEDAVAWIKGMIEMEMGGSAGRMEVRVDVHRTRRGVETATPSVVSDKDEQGENDALVSVINVLEGRADVEGTIRRNIASTPNDAGGMAVVVCGPSSLNLETRRAVCAVNTPSAVAKGQPPIHFYSEQFGW